MRVLLLPITTRRTLIYCERLQESTTPGTKAPVSERIINKASETWIAWEKAEKGWKRQVTRAGNLLLQRIPFEEYGLKSLPAFSQRRRDEIDSKKLEFCCLYPGAFIKSEKVLDTLGKLAKERQAFHRQRLIYCLIGMPISAPFMIVPVIPNLPFYYLCYRAYSNYRALYGSKTLEYIVEKELVDVQASQKMDEMYVAGLLHPNGDDSNQVPSTEEITQIQKVVRAQTRGDKDEVMLLTKSNGHRLAEALHEPELQVHLERAVEQVEAAMAKQRDAQQQAGKEKAQ